MYGYNPFFQARPPQMWGAPMPPQNPPMCQPQPPQQQQMGMWTPPQPPQQQRLNQQQYPPRTPPSAGRGVNSTQQPQQQSPGQQQQQQRPWPQQGGNFQNQPPQRYNVGAPGRPGGPPRPQPPPEQSAELEIWIVRHGETIENKTRTIAGHNTSGLTPHGNQQAELVAERLRGMKFTAVFISDLVRTQQTAEWILKTLGPGHQTFLDRRLREKGAGSYVGYKLGYSEHMAQVHGFSVRHFRPPGNGESWEDVAARGRAFLKEVVDKYCVPPAPKVPSSTIASGASTPQGPRSEAASPLPGKGAAHLQQQQQQQQQQPSPNGAAARPPPVQGGGGSPLGAARGRGNGQRPIPPPRSPIFDEKGYAQDGGAPPHRLHPGQNQLLGPRPPGQQVSPPGGGQKSPLGGVRGGSGSPQHSLQPRKLLDAASPSNSPPQPHAAPGQTPPRAHPAQGAHPSTPPAQRPAGVSAPPTQSPAPSTPIGGRRAESESVTSVESVEEHVWDADSPPESPRSAPGCMVTVRHRANSLPGDSFAQDPLRPSKPGPKAGSAGAQGSGEVISVAKLSPHQAEKCRVEREERDKVRAVTLTDLQREKEAREREEELARLAKEEEEVLQSNRILLVTHGGFIGEMLAGARCPSQRAPKNCSIHVMHVLRKGPRVLPEFRLKVEQDVEHLKVLTEDNKGHLNHIPTTETAMVPKLRQQGSQKKLVEYNVMFL